MEILEDSPHGSRARERAYSVRLSGDSPFRTNPGTGPRSYPAPRAAAWDQWGIFLAALFAADPHMIAGGPGKPTYADAEDFHAKTAQRFTWLTYGDSRYHRLHKFEWDGEHRICKCGAIDARYP